MSHSGPTNHSILCQRSLLFSTCVLKTVYIHELTNVPFRKEQIW
jgi:hypothetical protein